MEEDSWFAWNAGATDDEKKQVIYCVDEAGLFHFLIFFSFLFFSFSSSVVPFSFDPKPI